MKFALATITTLMALSFNANAAVYSYSNSGAVSDLTLGITLSPSLTTYCVIDFCKVVDAAREDIAVFVATEGAVHTAAMEQVLKMARENGYQGEDLAIATQILGDIAQ